MFGCISTRVNGETNPSGKPASVVALLGEVADFTAFVAIEFLVLVAMRKKLLVD
jgi:hypothetical protein